MEKGGEKSWEAEKEENLGKKLRREVLIGKRCGPSTPVPSWRIWAPPPQHHNTSFFSYDISARKLAAALWEFHHYLPIPKMHRPSNNGLSNGAVGSSLTRRRYFHHHHQQQHHSHKDKALELSNFLGDPCPSSPEQSASASSLRRHVAASLLQHHQSIERNNQALQPVSPSYESSMEVAPYNPAITPSSSLDFKGRLGESHYSLKTSTELLKVLNRIWSLEEQHASNIALIKALKTELGHTHVKMKELLRQRQADRHDMDDLIKEIAEDKLGRKNKEEDRIKAAIQSMRDELENERKLRKRSESLHRKFARDLPETKSSLVNALNEIERERKFRMLLEDLCDEFARGIKHYESLVHGLKQKPGRADRDGLILHISEAWLDERMQMQQESNGADDEKSVVEKLQLEIESFLDAKRYDANDSKNDQSLRERRHSLESVPLNGAASAPQAGDDEDSQDSDSHCFELNKPNNTTTTTHENENVEDNLDEARESNDKQRKLGSHEGSKSRTPSSLQVRFEEQIAWAMSSNGNKKDRLLNTEHGKTKGLPAEVNKPCKAENCEDTDGASNNKRRNNHHPIHGSNPSHMLDNLIRNQLSLKDGDNVHPEDAAAYGEASCSNTGWRNQASPVRQWTIAAPEMNATQSSSLSKLPPGPKENTLHAKLIEARSKGSRSRLKLFK